MIFHVDAHINFVEMCTWNVSWVIMICLWHYMYNPASEMMSLGSAGLDFTLDLTTYRTWFDDDPFTGDPFGGSNVCVFSEAPAARGKKGGTDGWHWACFIPTVSQQFWPSSRSISDVKPINTTYEKTHTHTSCYTQLILSKVCLCSTHLAWCFPMPNIFWGLKSPARFQTGCWMLRGQIKQ